MTTATKLEECKGRLDAKKEQLEKLQTEVETLQTELETLGQEFLESMGITNGKPKKKAKGGGASGPRWTAKQVLKILSENEPMTHKEITVLLNKEKPSASLAKLGDYLEKFSNNKPEGLKLNAAGRKLVS